MFYTDCVCENHEGFKTFESLELAENNYKIRKCKIKILYKDSDDSKGFVTLLKESK